VVHVAPYAKRNWTLGEDVSREQIYDRWEALHPVPSLVTRWRPDSEPELLL
jgi:hypothetical protein